MSFASFGSFPSSLRYFGLAALLLLSAACEKSPGGADVATGGQAAPSPGASQAPLPEEPGEFDLEQKSEEEADAAQGAQSLSTSPAAFDDSATPEFKKAFRDLEHWAETHDAKVHAALVDLESDKWLLRSREDEAVNVASNAKIVTAAAALELLGPAFTFRTELLGQIDAKGICKRLVIRGGGAPDLSVADLWRLVLVARGRGLKEVGEIVVDQSRFSERYVPPAFEQQPKEWAPFRAPVSALALDENTVTLNVSTTAEGEAARVWYYPAGIVRPTGRVETGKKGKGDRVSWSLNAGKSPQYLESKVGGSLAEGLGRRSYSRRLEDPRLAGGLALQALLDDAGISVKGEVTLGEADKEPRLALWVSQPVAELVRELGKDSNNFVAEMLFIALSASLEGKEQEALPWSSERGAEAVTGWLKAKGLEFKGTAVKNGSGLFDADRYSAELLVSLMASLEDNPRIFQDFMSQLAIGNTDGTMRKRMKGHALAPRIRAKTGTLRDVIALSGYIQRPLGRSPAAFSITVTGVAGRYGQVRSRVDKTVLSWTEILEQEIVKESP